MIVIWTEEARADLRAISSYLGSRSTTSASSLIDAIVARATQLQDHPHLGAVVPEYDDEALRELLEYPYRIVYRLTVADQVAIVAVVHSSRHLPRGL